jgi:hypothetical protein
MAPECKWLLDLDEAREEGSKTTTTTTRTTVVSLFFASHKTQRSDNYYMIKSMIYIDVDNCVHFRIDDSNDAIDASSSVRDRLMVIGSYIKIKPLTTTMQVTSKYFYCQRFERSEALVGWSLYFEELLIWKDGAGDPHGRVFSILHSN